MMTEHLNQLLHRAEMLASDLRMAKSQAQDDGLETVFEMLEGAEDQADGAAALIRNAIAQID